MSTFLKKESFTRMKPKEPATEYQLFQPFIGKWKTTGKMYATRDTPEQKITGTDTYSWMTGKYFILHKADVLMGDQRNKVLEIIGYDARSKAFSMQSYNNTGQSTKMKATYSKRGWKFEGSGMRFRGDFNAKKDIISGIWEKGGKSGNWKPVMKIKLERMR